MRRKAVINQMLFLLNKMITVTTSRVLHLLISPHMRSTASVPGLLSSRGLLFSSRLRSIVGGPSVNGSAISYDGSLLGFVSICFALAAG